ncbi:hypothetical protein E3N88_12413 [Mikania micrantha]|uniref:Uncharacterized protein n=1 Tax=Mikania micrantha TaxID=192012 RepID=A0A5N6P7G1_9ASTR|nr:hypothetical protein E3N88_12413 [Mikania micrantha]
MSDSVCGLNRGLTPLSGVCTRNPSGWTSLVWGNRFRALDDSMKTVQDNQATMRKDVDTIMGAVTSQQQSINELIRRLETCNRQERS